MALCGAGSAFGQGARVPLPETLPDHPRLLLSAEEIDNLKALRAEDITRLELRAKFAESAVAMAGMSSGWSWNGGWSGDKFTGALTYPSLWAKNHWELRRRARISYWDSVQARQLVVLAGSLVMRGQADSG